MAAKLQDFSAVAMIAAAMIVRRIIIGTMDTLGNIVSSGTVFSLQIGAKKYSLLRRIWQFLVSTCIIYTVLVFGEYKSTIDVYC